jgi:hypothetical protein
MSRHVYANSDGVADVSEQQIAAHWLLEAPRLRDRVQARLPAMPNVPRDELLSAIARFLR